MSVQIENPRKKKKGVGKAVIFGIVLVLGICVGLWGGNKLATSESKVTKLGFENIGELVTQAAYCTEVYTIDAARGLPQFKIPFTQSTYIYSYDVVIKAGFDFQEIKYEINGSTINVKLPEARVLSNEMKMDSLKVYYEKESIFRNITLEENNAAMKDLKEKAQEQAIGNGLLENARSNAETILMGFFAGAYDMENYEVVFENG